MKEIGFYGGTFDPFHLGHLKCAECAREKFGLKKILFVPSASPIHKSGVLDAEERYRMVENSLTRYPFFEVSRVDIERTTESEIDSLKVIYEDGARFNIILGSDYLSPDNAWNLANWVGADELLKRSRILIVPRGDDTADLSRHWAAKFPKATIEVADCTGLPISSSQIRELVRQEKPIVDLVPSAVAEIIARKGFYKREAEPLSRDFPIARWT